MKVVPNEFAFRMVEVAAGVRPSKCCEIAHPIDEKLCVLNGVILFEFRKVYFRRVTNAILGKSSLQFNLYSISISSFSRIVDSC